MQIPTSPTTRTIHHRYDGMGGFAPNSSKIPVVDALLYVGGTAALVWATLRIAFWIWG